MKPLLYAPVLMVAVVVGCATEVPAPARADAVPVVRLVSPDSSTDESGTTYVWYRVAVAVRGREDTLADVTTLQEPLLTTDGLLSGFSFDNSGMIRSGYRYSPVTRALEHVTLPVEISPYFSEAAISPNGRLFAYISQDSGARMAAVLRSWPTGAELARADAGAGFASDVNFNHLRWRNDDLVEFAIRVDEGNGGPWIHLVLSPQGAVSKDTLRREPTTSQRSWGP
jgi:hypothetical protein